MSRKKTIAITGASRGIGLAIAEMFLKRGWNVATCSRSDMSHQSFHHTVCDVTQVAEVNSWLDKVVENYQNLDVVVNNAGVISESSDSESWHQVLNTNLSAAWYVSQRAHSFLPKDGTGRIVNISSVLGLVGVADQPAYCAAKHGLIGLTKSLALRWAQDNITVNAICPGWVNTDMFEKRLEQLDLGVKTAQDANPLGTIVQPHEIAELVWFLCTTAGKSMTGLAIPVDSGALAGPYQKGSTDS